MAERTVCPVEEFTFTCQGLELDGYVMKPVNFDPAKKYPGILTVHGGPRATFGPTFFHESQVFANAGYFVFFTNPLGSDGRGNEFADITGKHGGIDFDCCMAMTDEVLKRYPQLDEKRLGIICLLYTSMRIMDIFLAIPGTLLAICIVASLGNSIPNLVIAQAIASTPTFARVVRGAVLTVRGAEYVEAARCV